MKKIFILYFILINLITVFAKTDGYIMVIPDKYNYKQMNLKAGVAIGVFNKTKFKYSIKNVSCIKEKDLYNNLVLVGGIDENKISKKLLKNSPVKYYNKLSTLIINNKKFNSMPCFLFKIKNPLKENKNIIVTSIEFLDSNYNSYKKEPYKNLKNFLNVDKEENDLYVMDYSGLIIKGKLKNNEFIYEYLFDENLKKLGMEKIEKEYISLCYYPKLNNYSDIGEKTLNEYYIDGIKKINEYVKKILSFYNYKINSENLKLRLYLRPNIKDNKIIEKLYQAFPFRKEYLDLNSAGYSYFYFGSISSKNIETFYFEITRLLNHYFLTSYVNIENASINTGAAIYVSSSIFDNNDNLEKMALHIYKTPKYESLSNIEFLINKFDIKLSPYNYYMNGFIYIFMEKNYGKEKVLKLFYYLTENYKMTENGLFNFCEGLKHVGIAYEEFISNWNKYLKEETGKRKSELYPTCEEYFKNVWLDK